MENIRNRDVSKLQVLLFQVRHPVAIRFLFHEAYYNCIESMYPCSDQDVMHLAAILMQLYQGDFDQRKAKNYLNRYRCFPGKSGWCSVE